MRSTGLAGSRRLAILAFAALFLVPGAMARAQGSAPPDTLRRGQIGSACADSTYRQFDFWIGVWTVRDSAGVQAGASRISRQAEGCAIREEWRGADGSTGTSLNYLDRSERRWHQDWVGGTGLILHLTGGLEGKAMVLSGSRRGSGGAEVLHRITWTPLADGRVSQEWVTSADQGKNWKRLFLGFYERLQQRERQ